MRIRLVPCDRIVIESRLPVEDVAAALREALARSRHGTPFGKGGLTGTVSGSRFKLRRRLGLLWWNPFEPTADGHVEATATGCKLDGTIRLNRLVALFMVVWLGIAGLGMIATLAGAVNSGWNKAGPGVFWATFTFATSYGLCMWGFWSSVPKLKMMLHD